MLNNWILRFKFQMCSLTVHHFVANVNIFKVLTKKKKNLDPAKWHCNVTNH